MTSLSCDPSAPNSCAAGMFCDPASRNCVAGCTSSSCPAGTTCNSSTNVCQSSGGPLLGCDPNNDRCGANAFCNPETLACQAKTLGCTDSSNCPSGSSCVNGYCQSNGGLLGGCTEDGNCAPNMKCQNGKCVNAKKKLTKAQLGIVIGAGAVILLVIIALFAAAGAARRKRKTATVQYSPEVLSAFGNFDGYGGKQRRGSASKRRRSRY